MVLNKDEKNLLSGGSFLLALLKNIVDFYSADIGSAIYQFNAFLEDFPDTGSVNTGKRSLFHLDISE
jgi:hypothetical protein